MRAWPFVGAAVVVAGAAIAAYVVLPGSPDDDVAADDTVAERDLEPVVRRDLARTDEFDGTVGYGPATPLALAGNGTLTSLPAVGDVISPGDAVVEVDGVPVIALAGAFPMWRALGPGVDDGKDVLQLEYTLYSLGYHEDGTLTVDEEWTSTTTLAVKAFQEDHGQDDDGTIDVGDLVWIDAPVRVADVGGVPGKAPAEAAIEVTATVQSVFADVPVEDGDLLPVGATVDVELPDGAVVAGTVVAVGAVETSDQGETTLPIEIALGTADAVPQGTPVDVVVRTVSAEDVLVVPVESVLALAEGGYAVEVALANGATELVGVELGTFADGDVEITGDLAEGDEVVVP